MIHFYSSEVTAFIVLVLLFLFFLLVNVAQFDWWQRLSRFELGVMLLGCAFSCRMTAKGANCKWPEGVDFTGRVALVIGASSGVGYAVAEELAMHGWTVILAGRDATRLLLAQRRIVRKLAFHRATGTTKVLGTVDLSVESSVRSFAQTIADAQERYPIALLVNAAGVIHRRARFCHSNTNWAGLESMIATNAVGPFLLTLLLMPALGRTAERTGVTSRVVNVASSCHTFLGFRKQSQYDPIQMLRGLEEGAPVVRKASTDAAAAQSQVVDEKYRIRDFSFSNFIGYYGLSKLCVVWNTRILAREVANWTFADPSQLHEQQEEQQAASKSTSTKQRGNAQEQREEREKNQQAQEDSRKSHRVFVACCHPGIITTHLYRELFPIWVLDRLIYLPSLLLGKTWTEGAQSALKAAVEDTNMIHGGYYMCGGEYGLDSGVNCLSKHATNVDEERRYREWLVAKLPAPVPTISTTAEEKSTAASDQ